MAIVCAACGGAIADRTLLNVLDRFWHTACLNCSYCGLRLDELGPSVFVRENMLLCRQDYLRLFGLSGTCAKCEQKIPPDELVMRCQNSVYHVNCFSCVRCHAPLQPGDKVCAVNGSLFCEHEFPHLFLPSQISMANLKNPRFTSQLSSCSSPSTSSAELVRSIMAQKNLTQTGCRSSHTMNSGGTGGFLNRSSPNEPQLTGVLDTSSTSSQPMEISYSILPITQSELAAAMNSHPSSPAFPFNGGTSQSFMDRSPGSMPGVCLSDPYSDPGSFNGDMIAQPMVQSMPSEKPGKITASANPSSDAPTGRKKQKKVDSRRCPPLRVC